MTYQDKGKSQSERNGYNYLHEQLNFILKNEFKMLLTQGFLYLFNVSSKESLLFLVFKTFPLLKHKYSVILFLFMWRMNVELLLDASLQENTICHPSDQTLFHNLHPASDWTYYHFD
jgi:hypothetical protein